MIISLKPEIMNNTLTKNTTEGIRYKKRIKKNLPVTSADSPLSKRFGRNSSPSVLYSRVDKTSNLYFPMPRASGSGLLYLLIFTC